MSIEMLVRELRRLAVQTGSLSEACLGCGHEHNCSVHGCQLIKEAADELEDLDRFCGSSLERLLGKYNALEKALQESEAARTDLAWRLVSAEKALHETKSEVRCGECIYMHDRGKNAVVCDKMNYAAVTEDGGCYWGERRQV